MKKKILATLLTGLVLGTSLVGCGKQKEQRQEKN